MDKGTDPVDLINNFWFKPKTVVKPINESLLTEESQKVAQKHPRGWITRNTRCPCDSGRRFKNCCMETKQDRFKVLENYRQGVSVKLEEED